MRHRLLVVALVAGLGLPGAPASSTAKPAAAAPWGTWSELKLQARGVPMFSGQFVMRRNAGGGRCRIESEAVARFLGAPVARSRTVSITEDGTGRTTKHVSLSRKRGRRYVVGEHSYSVERLRPPAEPNRPDDAWPVVSRREFDVPVGQSGKALPMYDFYAMLLRLPAEQLAAPGDEAALVVPTTDGPRRYRIRVAESRTRQRAFIDGTTGRKGPHEIRELRLTVIPPADDEDGFLDMQGETEIWVEARTKTPVEISGRVPRVGRVRLELVELR